MLIVLLIISILATVGCIIWNYVEDWDECGPNICFFFSILGLALAIIGFVVAGKVVGTARLIDDKILMYEEENTRIEQSVGEAVSAYLSHEKDVFGAVADNINPDSIVTIVAAYPDLASSELIAKQIEVYTNNNDKIKSLKEDKINVGVAKWWLNFGR